MDLPRKRIEYDLTEEQKVCACCQGALHRIGEDVGEQLHILPQTPWVWQHVRFKYGCYRCERHGVSAPVVRAAMPPQPLPGSVADAATIATFMTCKYAAVPDGGGIRARRDRPGPLHDGALDDRHQPTLSAAPV